MENEDAKNVTVHISSKSHLNLTFNLNKTGNTEVLPGKSFIVQPDDTYTLVYVNKGIGVLEYDSLWFKMEAGNGFFSFPDMLCNFKNIGEESADIYWLTFSGYMVENYLNRANIHRIQPIYGDPTGEIGGKIANLYAASHRLPNRYCRMVSILYDVFSFLLDANPTKQSGNYVDNANYFAVKAVTFIEQNYFNDITVDSIAAAIGISRKHLYSVFNDIIKISPKQYLIYYRIEKACKRLRGSRQLISEIAESVGYGNPFYFAREFKRLIGVTASEYRRDPFDISLFNYHQFMPTIANGGNTALSTPYEEQIISVYTPPEPVNPLRI